MSEWKEVRLGDFALVKGGKRLPKGKILTTKKNSHPYIRIRDLGQEKVLEINDTYEYVDDETQQAISRYIVSTNDILISIVGTIGLVAIVGKSLDNANLTENCVKLVNIEDVDKEYLYYFLVSKSGQDAIKNEVVGAVQQKLPIKNIQNIKVPLPPLTEQHRIASILSALDSKIENNRKICANLEAQAQALFKHWFIDFAPFKDGKFVESELGMIPEGWRVGTFTEIFNLCPGGTPKTSESSYWENGNIPFFSPKDVTGIYCFKTEKQITKEGLNNCSSRLYDTNTVLITCRGTVGKVTMSAVPMAMNQSNYAILAKEGYSQYYAYLMTVAIVRKLKFKAVGSVFDAITSKDFNEKIIIPDFATLKSFDSLISTFFEEIKAKGFESSRLTTLRDTLLPKLMSGELRVNDTETT